MIFMTVASLTEQIEQSLVEFRRLYAGPAKRRPAELNRLITLQAERIARLYRFRSMLLAKEYCLQISER